MRRSNLRFVAAAALAAIALAACSSSSKTASPDTTPTTEAPTTTAAPTATTSAPTTVAGAGTATVKVADSTLGKILVDANGMTLYVDENDKPGKPACTDTCLQAWPPVPAPETFVKGPGVTAAKFGAATLADGTKQLTVNDTPLYTWVQDKKPGDVTGQDKNGFYVVQADGTKYDPGAAAGS